MNADSVAVVAVKVPDVFPIQRETSQVITFEGKLILIERNELTLQPFVRCQLYPIVVIRWWLEVRAIMNFGCARITSAVLSM